LIPEAESIHKIRGHAAPSMKGSRVKVEIRAMMIDEELLEKAKKLEIEKV
tara:strand:+ start:258 stop:407 length:150 start_codon:yes stop_codon:yes gene_type:complete